ncbi:hypothetical protein QYM36_019276 [Artemia franciscana]|uniref:Reverse transcriptase/retrotransposon-derived protein RNase H-like domain-containing protein n=1 Tax=Artemia franciscana TaxID=6661 RepID=A0AA88KTM1_ARTSF|nr:hypothetical protein QYM36_019276 [Artemia franciscana]
MVNADVRKAFDTSSHEEILKCKEGFHPFLIKIVESFLSERKQKTKYKNNPPNTTTLTFGIPQGTKLELGKQATVQWTDVHKSEMEKIKVSICHNLEAFDAQSKEVELKTDASKHGLGAELLTHGKIVAFATKALNEMKQCYSQAPPRLQRMIYQIQAYDLEVHSIIGKDILEADALSSLHPSEENDEFQNEIEFHVNSFVKHILNFREELAVVNGIILKAGQIVIASTIQPNILQHLHVPHMGMEKTKWKAQSVMKSGQTM